jgi:hypothetical protein
LKDKDNLKITHLSANGNTFVTKDVSKKKNSIYLNYKPNNMAISLLKENPSNL